MSPELLLQLFIKKEVQIDRLQNEIQKLQSIIKELKANLDDPVIQDRLKELEKQKEENAS